MYLAVLFPVGLRSRRLFKRATDAYAYATRLKARCEKLYDERVESMASVERSALAPTTELP